jgi:hypothetical protein
MNERIAELYEQAIDFTMNYHNDNSKATQKELDRVCARKFSELIIQEYSYDVMNLTSMPDHVAFAARKWGVEL